jgi:predicted MPP superfamily phosphohydrolase
MRYRRSRFPHPGLRAAHAGILAAFALLAVAVAQRNTAPDAPVEVHLPLADKSTRFAIIGDNGNASKEQYQIAALMERYRQAVHFDFVLMLGDNIYGSKTPADFRSKFETPYKPLLDNGVKFYASLGNHDDPNEDLYKLFNMNGHRYYNFKRGDATFFALDSTYMDSTQLDWLDQELGKAKTPWKICYFHHPLYSDAMHGPDLDLRRKLEPLFQKYGVNVVLSGHEHVYERFAPQKGISYFVLGNSGELRYHDLKPSASAAKQFDTDRSFGMFELTAKDLSFQVVSRAGLTVDTGTLAPPAAPAEKSGQ